MNNAAMSGTHYPLDKEPTLYIYTQLLEIAAMFLKSSFASPPKKESFLTD